MNKNNWFSILALLALVIGVLYLKNSNNEGSEVLNDGIGGDIVLNRSPDRIIYTKHAKCRMECRFFSKKEVREILLNGKVNQRKSQPNDKPCPSYALEGRTSDGQLARMVFAACGNEQIKVITCIDLETDYSCDCY